jgi:hypothetical protein
MPEQTVQDSLRALAPTTFASKYMFESVPHVFGSDMDRYIEWKTQLGALIDVDPRAITIIGSAGVGVSLNPFKGLKPFGPKSDVDVAVVSAYHFELSWRFLRSMKASERFTLSFRQRESLRDHVSRHVYFGVIATDRILEILPFAQPWVAAMSEMSGVAPTAGRDVNARIYRDFEALRAYQMRSVVDARGALPEEASP